MFVLIRFLKSILFQYFSLYLLKLYFQLNFFKRKVPILFVPKFKAFLHFCSFLQLYLFYVYVCMYFISVHDVWRHLKPVYIWTFEARRIVSKVSIVSKKSKLICNQYLEEYLISSYQYWPKFTYRFIHLQQ